MERITFFLHEKLHILSLAVNSQWRLGISDSVAVQRVTGLLYFIPQFTERLIPKLPSGSAPLEEPILCLHIATLIPPGLFR